VTDEVVAVFAYGSLVAPASAAATLGRGPVEIAPATLSGWRRSWTLKRDNRRCEKTFSRADGSIPEHVLALDVAPDPGATVNGALVLVSDAELARLDRRELRYDRVEVTLDVAVEQAETLPSRTFTYVAKPENRASGALADAVVLGTYERAVEMAFSQLGPGELERFRATTAPSDVERVEPVLIADSIPAGNPRAW